MKKIQEFDKLKWKIFQSNEGKFSDLFSQIDNTKSRVKMKVIDGTSRLFGESNSL